jgi:hypothetical protein
MKSESRKPVSFLLQPVVVPEPSFGHRLLQTNDLRLGLLDQFAFGRHKELLPEERAGDELPYYPARNDIANPTNNRSAVRRESHAAHWNSPPQRKDT